MGGAYVKSVLPEKNNDNIIRALSNVIKQDRVTVVKFLLGMKGGECVVPGMNGVDLTRALSVAVHSHNMTIADYLLSKSSAGSCLLLRVKVTEDAHNCWSNF